MQAPDWAQCSEEDLWRYVATHLEQHGLRVVLVGGAVVSIYTRGLYRSGDLDLIVQSFFKTKLPDFMQEIGFVPQGRHYRHPECSHLFVEFPAGPLGIGEDMAIKPDEIPYEGIALRILSPTDCIRDRLASYIHFGVRECLEQAVQVALQHPFNSERVRQWCLKEKAEFAWLDFQIGLSDKR